MSEYRQDDRNDGYCPVCAQPLTGLTVAGRGYCEQHGWQWADWNHRDDDGEADAREGLYTAWEMLG